VAAAHQPQILIECNARHVTARDRLDLESSAACSLAFARGMQTPHQRMQAAHQRLAEVPGASRYKNRHFAA
jgi:hypothetical protein